jgi:hypothetical protein
MPGVANVAAAGAGDSVSITVSGLTLPSVYAVHALPSQPAIVSVGSKTVGGFVLTLTPPSSSITLAAAEELKSNQAGSSKWPLRAFPQEFF